MDYSCITSKLKEYNLAETFPELRRKVSSLGIWSLTEKVENLWITYQQMMQFMLQGFHDSQSEKIRQDICHQLEIIVGRLERFERMAKYPSDKYTQARKNLDNVPSFESIVSDMEKLALELKQVKGDELIRESVRQYHLERLESLHESATLNLFNWTWTSELWQNADVNQANQFIFSEHISSNDKAVFISAVTLSLLEFVDIAKLLFLLDSYLVDDDHVSQRALIGFLLAFYIHFNEIKTCTEIENRLSIYRDDSLFLHDVYAAMMQLQMSCTTDSVSSKIRNDIMPVLMRGVMPKKTSGQDFNVNEWMKNGENPEWMDNEKMDKKMHEMADLQLEGADVYYASFATLKGYSFFSQIPHWFYPFSFDSIHIPELKKMLEGSAGKFIKLILNGSPFCNSDKYSLCFTFSNLGQMGKTAIEDQISNQIPNEMDINDLTENAELNTSKKDIRRHYIFDLYRFFYSYPYKQQFKNPFDILKKNPLTPLSNPWLKHLLCAQKEDLAQYADFLKNINTRNRNTIQSQIALNKNKLERIKSVGVLSSPERLLDSRRMSVLYCSEKLQRCEGEICAAEKIKLAQMAAKLGALNPLGIISRGYSAVTDVDGGVVKSVDQLEAGDLIKIRFVDGDAQATVNRIESKK